MENKSKVEIDQKIKEFIENLLDPKRSEINTLHQMILELNPACKLWFFDGKNAEGKIVSNPNIGYGSHMITYADGSTKEFYQVGISPNTTGISVYIMSIADKKYLAKTYADTIGKASVSGYCIKFKSIDQVNISVLMEAVRDGMNR